jgi:hypothetical protein
MNSSVNSNKLNSIYGENNSNKNNNNNKYNYQLKNINMISSVGN